MTNTKQHEDEFHLIRNNNGEWISEDNAVFLSNIEAGFLQMRAAQNGMSLSVQHGPGNSLWCYKHEYEKIISRKVEIPQIKYRKLKIEKRMRNTVDTTKPETYRGDKPFKRTARTHQSNFRATYLKVPFDPDDKFGKYGAFLMPLDADKGLNFCDDYRDEIMEKIKTRYPKLTATQHDGLYANMLRSEHIPWNVFIPMTHDKDATAQVFNDILGLKEIDEVTDIRIEWAPDKAKCLNDNTSFDTYIEYLHEGKTCGMGIEVKYTEEGYPFGVKEHREVMENEQSMYAQITKSCGWFIPEISNLPIRETPLCKDEYRQIWRNHILGASMLPNHLAERFHSITLYPKGNPHFNEVLPKYEQFLTDEGRSSFGYITIEDLIDLIEQYFPKNKEFQNWINYLRIRYPF
ncbi:MAG: hypothetical protein IK120_04030 [Muribaculaceae bacterium]|nr:hypothetical protein [Muribaculaceae bacterium]